jgi:hypothetical protein
MPKERIVIPEQVKMIFRSNKLIKSIPIPKRARNILTKFISFRFITRKPPSSCN